MALIAMAVYSTEENQKDRYLEQTLQSLKETVDFSKHRLILSVNAQTKKTHKLFSIYRDFVNRVIYNDTNIGTAEAINKAWKERLPGENAIKMDDDVVIHSKDWIYLMEEAIRRDATIGQVGLKRRDCMEAPWTEGWYQSKLIMLPHQSGEKWIIGEEVNHVMGTCVMHSSALLDKVGYLYQPGVYGFDDSFMTLRSRLAGFRNIFLTGIDIEHIDPGTTPFQKWKEMEASKVWNQYKQDIRDYQSGKKPIYYDPYK